MLLFCAVLIFAQIILRRYAQNLFRVMRNNAEYCSKVVPLHAQKFAKINFCVK